MLNTDKAQNYHTTYLVLCQLAVLILSPFWYNLNMSKFMHYLQILYFVFQCIASVVNSWLTITVFWNSYLFFLFLLQYIPTFIVVVLISLMLIFYTILTPISAIATFRTIHRKKLTKLQKISRIVFPVITVPLYAFLVWIVIFSYSYLAN